MVVVVLGIVVVVTPDRSLVLVLDTPVERVVVEGVDVHVDGIFVEVVDSVRVEPASSNPMSSAERNTRRGQRCSGWGGDDFAIFQPR